MTFVKQLDTWGIDGEILQIQMPSEIEVSNLISSRKEHRRLHLGKFLSLRLLYSVISGCLDTYEASRIPLTQVNSDSCLLF